MNNSLLTKVSTYGLTLMSDQIKNNISKYILIGSTNTNDVDLIAALEDNDVNNNLTYGVLASKGWIGYEGEIRNKYYDANNFLTIDISLPIEEDLNIYVYGFGLIDNTGSSKKIISITRSPSIFNKVKNTTSTFSIKMTFGQEDVNSQFRDNIHDSMFINTDFIFLATANQGSNIIECSENVSSYIIGTKLKGDGLQENTVIVDTFYTDNSLTVNQLKLSKPVTKNISNEAIFEVEVFYKQDDFVTRGELAKWQNEHNHNKQYYLKDETVQNSNKLGGKSSNFYATIENIEDILSQLKTKIGNEGGTVRGSLLSDLSKSSEFRENEFVPLFYITSLLENLKNYVTADYDKSIKEYLHKNLGSLNNLNTFDKSNIVSSINEILNYLGNYKTINYSDKNFVSVINFLLNSIGNSTTVNGKSLVENINELILNKADKNNPEFSKTAICSEDLDYSSMTDSQIPTIKNIKQSISTLRKDIEIDLSSESIGMTFPIVLNESGYLKYTDTIIRNEKNTTLNSNMRLEIKGNGSSNGLECAYLSVRNSAYGLEKFVKNIVMYSTSSTITVWLRGGSKYFLTLNGTDKDPIVVKTEYRLKNSATIVRPESWDSINKLQLGYWEYNNINQINIDNSVNPHLFNG